MFLWFLCFCYCVCDFCVFRLICDMITDFRLIFSIITCIWFSSEFILHYKRIDLFVHNKKYNHVPSILGDYFQKICCRLAFLIVLIIQLHYYIYSRPILRGRQRLALTQGIGFENIKLIMTSFKNGISLHNEAKLKDDNS